jgi:hypothetical protein
MAGILNNKSRMMDTIITREGRRQIASGQLKIKYVTFTDRHTFYEQRDDDAADDADTRLFFEATHRSQDQIIFETDDEGRFRPFNGADVKIRHGKLYRSTGAKHKEITGPDIPQAIYELLDSAANNFTEQRIIGSKDKYSDSSEFEFHPKGVTFKITDNEPFKSNAISDIEIEKVESLHQDERLQHLPFYQYLPPTNKPKPGMPIGEVLGAYARLNQEPILKFEDLEPDLATKQHTAISYIETSLDNNLVMQLLEVTPNGVEKLALIDFGEFATNNDPNTSGKRVYFAGKIFEDGNGMQTFVNMFTIVFE